MGLLDGILGGVVGAEMATVVNGLIEKHGGEKRLAAKQVFALTGYHPDYTFIKSLGVTLDEKSWKPNLNAETLESNVPGIFLAGVVIGGKHTSEIFIENGRFHGKQIIDSLVGKGRRRVDASFTR